MFNPPEGATNVHRQFNFLRDDLTEAHDRIAVMIRELREVDGTDHLRGFLSAAQSEVMSALDSINVAERHA